MGLELGLESGQGELTRVVHLVWQLDVHLAQVIVRLA